MKKKPLKWLAAFLIAASVGSSVIAYFFLGVDREKEKTERIMAAELANEAVLQFLSEPITVSRMISQDISLRQILEKESVYTEENMILMMRSYLNSIQKKFSFTSVYVVSEESKKYYTYVGLNKVIDPDNDSFDSWYTIFLQHGKPYELESSTDQVNRDKFTIFVDGRVENEQGKLLGVSGVGVETEEIREILARYEDNYGLRIDYISADGLVQISSRPQAVHSSYVSGIDLPDTNEKEFTYTTYGIDGFAIVKYVEPIGWYVVVRNDTESGTISNNYRFFFAEILILALALAVWFAISKNLRAEEDGITGGNRNVDKLTGLPNREYFMKIYGETGMLNTTQYQSLANFSIDEFESIENTPGCDRIVLSVVRTARETFGQRGQITRWHKNAFLMMLEMPVEEADAECRRFCKAVEDMGEVTISIGLTDIKLNDTLKNNYCRTVQNLYLVKELGGNNVKRG